MAEQLADHPLDIFVRMGVAIPKDHVVAGHLAFFLVRFLLGFGNHRGRLFFFGDNGFFGVHGCTCGVGWAPPTMIRFIQWWAVPTLGSRLGDTYLRWSISYRRIIL